jgi:hypothetical protein
MDACQRILKDIGDAMKSVKRHARRAAGRSSSIEGAMKKIDRTAEMIYIVECERLNRKYQIGQKKCDRCMGKRRCISCSGSGKKTGLLLERVCPDCKGTGVCQSCIARGDKILEVLKMAVVYARLRERLPFEETLKRMGIGLDEAALYQGIVNIAGGI